MPNTVFPLSLNQLVTSLGSTYAPSSGTLVLASGYGATILAEIAAEGAPAISSSHPVRVTVIIQSHARDNPILPTFRTIFQATGLSADSLTGVTAIEGTTDRAYSVGDIVGFWVTAGSYNVHSTAINVLETLEATTVYTSNIYNDPTWLTHLAASKLLGVVAPAQGGLPTGGTTGQVLAKTSGTDYATDWETPSAGAPSIGASGAIQAADGSGGFADSTLTTATVATHSYVAGLGFLTVPVTLAQMATMATASFLGRNTAGTGSPEVLSEATAKTMLGLGTAATHATADFLQTANNLSDVTAATARTNLGLGTLATQSGTFSGTSSGTNTGDQTITLTGDVTGSGTGSFAATLATVNSNVGSFTGANITVNAKGQVTAAANGSGGGGSPGGSSGQIQYDNSGSFGGFGHWDGVRLAVGSPGTMNTFIGDSSTGTSGASGSNNFGVGAFAFNAITSGTNNSAIGGSALQSLTSGNNNLGIGAGALFSVVTGGDDVGVGNHALPSTTGSFNVGIGSNSGTDNISGSQNVYIGYASGWVGGPSNLSNCTVLGAGAYATASNQVVLGKSNATAVFRGTGTFSRISSTSTDRDVAYIDAGFTVATDASYTGYGRLAAQDFNATAGGREALRWGTDGSAAWLTIGGGAQVKALLSATATLAFGTLTTLSQAELTISLTGATVGSDVEIGAPAAIEAGIGLLGYVSSAGVVTVRALNVTASPITMASNTFRATSFKS